MKLASIDPGIASGVAIVRITVGDKEVHIAPVALATYSFPRGGMEALFGRHYEIHAVVLENKPPKPSSAGIDSWYPIYEWIQRVGFVYRPEFGKVITRKGLSLIGPGEWKPVIKANKLKSFGGFNPQTPHEQDAVKLLHYWVRSNYPKKALVYDE